MSARRFSPLRPKKYARHALTSGAAPPLVFDLAAKMGKIDIWMLGTINMSSLK
jgi:hypothetical protein